MPIVTQHAVVQLGRRYALSWSAADLIKALGHRKAIFKMSGGEVVPFYIRERNIYGYAVLRNDKVATVLTEVQAFTDCPRAVFTFLIRHGYLARACSLRSNFKVGVLQNPQDEQSVRYPRSCDTVWCLFKYLEKATKRR